MHTLLLAVLTVTQAQTRDRPTAKTRQKRVDPDHLLPSGSFDGSRLQKIDADSDGTPICYGVGCHAADRIQFFVE